MLTIGVDIRGVAYLGILEGSNLDLVDDSGQAFIFK
jgi:hypothetical protein